MGKTGNGQSGKDRAPALPARGAPSKETVPVGAPAGGTLSKGQHLYETRRAKEAGLTLDAWMARKARAAASAAAASPRTSEKKKGKGLLARLIDRAHRPI